MDRAHVLAALNRKLLEAYSRRTAEALRAALPLRLVLPPLESFLALNVAKEVRKDGLVIGRAGELLAAGILPDGKTRQELFEATKEIDSAFLSRVRMMPVGIVIRYEEIAPVRLERIDRVLAAAYRVLDAWRSQRGIRAAIQAAYRRTELENLVLDVLRLYASETQALSRSLRLPALLAPIRDRLTHGLASVMNSSARRLAVDVAAAVYRRGKN